MNESTANEAWARETLRLHSRYLEEIVEGFHLCPWARRARVERRMARAVSFQSTFDPAMALEALRGWHFEDRVEIGFVLFPCLECPRDEFERFTNHVIDEDARRQNRTSAPFALAAFHPLTPIDLSTPDRLVPALRCTPHPTIQAVRMTALERVRAGEASGTSYVDVRQIRWDQLPTAPAPSLRERIAQANWETIRTESEAFARRIEAITLDRTETQHRLEHHPIPSVPLVFEESA